MMCAGLDYDQRRHTNRLLTTSALTDKSPARSATQVMAATHQTSGIGSKKTLLLIVLASVLPYVYSVSYDFVYDDGAEIVENRLVQSWSDLGSIFTSTAWAGTGRAVPMYRPVTTLSYLVNHTLTGLDPWSYHVVNIVLHALVCLLVYRLMLAWGFVARVALVAAVLFAVHPVHVEVVANVAGRKDLLSALFLIGMLLAHSRVDQDGWRMGATATLCYALACFSKEAGVVGIGLVVAQDFLLGERRAAAGRMVTYGSYAAVLVFWFVVRQAVVGGLWNVEVPFIDNPVANADWPIRVLTALSVIGRGLALQLLPLKLSPDYSFAVIVPVGRLSEPFLVFLLVVMGLLGAALTRPGWNRRLALMLLAFYGFALFPASNLVVPIGTIFGERLLYLPSVAFCAAAAWALGATARYRARLAPLLATLVTVALGLRAFSYTQAWASEETLFDYAGAVAPRSSTVLNKRGEILERSGNTRDAARLYRRALDIYQGNYQARLKLAVMLERTGQTDAVEVHLPRLVEDAPDNTEVLQALAQILKTHGRLPAAVRFWQRAIGLDPDYAPALGDLGTYYLVSGDLPRARALLERATRADPGLATAWYNLALVSDRLDDTATAVRARNAFLRTAGPEFGPQIREVRTRLDRFNGVGSD